MDEAGLLKNAANHIPLSPLSFLRRTARLYPDSPAVIYGERQYTWAQTQKRCGKLAAALKKHGIGKGDVVSFVAANTPELVEAHFGVPMAGCVLNAVNIRLDVDTLRYIFSHSEARAVFVDGEFADKVKAALDGLDKKPLVIDIVDSQSGDANPTIGECDYEYFINTAAEPLDSHPADEWEPLALNYTSGTTGEPKGVVYHHRGSYLMSFGSAIAWNMKPHGVYLYTVPMFHCNGWGYVWTQALLGGTLICIRKVDPVQIFRLIEKHNVDALGGAPIVLNMLINAPTESRLNLGGRKIKMMTAGAPPPATTLAAMEEMGFVITHVYGLTESYGHTIFCDWRGEWDSLSGDARAELKARQGVGYPMLEDWAIVDGDMNKLPADGKTMGEIVMRGNTLMSGYLKNPQATENIFSGEWFKSGDLAVMHPDQYLQVKDRAKDIIISGGENISSVEVENVITKHPRVSLAAVVAMPNDKWGETPCAFVELTATDDNTDEKNAGTRTHRLL